VEAADDAQAANVISSIAPAALPARRFIGHSLDESDLDSQDCRIRNLNLLLVGVNVDNVYD